MTTIGQPFTAGQWLVKEGEEEAFIQAWTEFAEWTGANFQGSGPFVLLQSAEDGRRFQSFGAWPDAEAVSAWRGSDEFRPRIGACKARCDDFEPHDYTAAAEVGAPRA